MGGGGGGAEVLLTNLSLRRELFLGKKGNLEMEILLVGGKGKEKRNTEKRHHHSSLMHIQVSQTFLQDKELINSGPSKLC